MNDSGVEYFVVLSHEYEIDAHALSLSGEAVAGGGDVREDVQRDSCDDGGSDHLLGGRRRSEPAIPSPALHGLAPRDWKSWFQPMRDDCCGGRIDVKR